MQRPSMDRRHLEVLRAQPAPDAAAEWATKSGEERLAAALFLREATYGRDHLAIRVPRVLEV
ncbi:MAG: hypothetical protein EBU70_13515, partial [Actinobacteria bacterium]|nr:hypothetical protein [Actinomycetota bacterium]